jgi:hypothetical protein
MSRVIWISLSVLCAATALAVPWVCSYVAKDVEYLSRVWWGFPLFFTGFSVFCISVGGAVSFFCLAAETKKPPEGG